MKGIYGKDLMNVSQGQAHLCKLTGPLARKHLYNFVVFYLSAYSLNGMLLIFHYSRTFERSLEFLRILLFLFLSTELHFHDLQIKRAYH